MLDVQKVLNHPYEYELNLKIPDTMATDIIEPMATGKVIKDCQIVFLDGFFEVLLDLRLLMLRKQVKLFLEIEQIELSKEVLIVNLCEHEHSYTSLLNLIELLGVDITSWLSIIDNKIILNLTDKWQVFIEKYRPIIDQWKTIGCTKYQIENHNILLSIKNV